MFSRINALRFFFFNLSLELHILIFHSIIPVARAIFKTVHYLNTLPDRPLILISRAQFPPKQTFNDLARTYFI